MECQRGELSMREISRKLGVNLSTVMKWKKRPTVAAKKRIRKEQMNNKIKAYVFKEAADKSTGTDQASSRKIANRVKFYHKLNISHTTINKFLQKHLKLQ